MRTDEIRFLLNGQVRELRNPPATRTVLNYLREDLRLTGTKEGCAEGDCGACTVVIAEIGADGALKCRAINSCIQFLPTLDGKAVFTVEGIKCHGTLHPVQQAMVELHGSQCGFCTPGIVMSLFALYKSCARPGRAEIEDALSGNLCRCTGYRPIVDAALAMHELGNKLPEERLEWLTAPAETDVPAVSLSAAALLETLRSLQRHTALESETEAGRFHAPDTLEELASLRARLPAARLLAGGTDIGLWITKQLRELPEIIYLGRVGELRRIDASGTDIEIGAAVTLAEATPLLQAHYPELNVILRRFASPPIRNAATLGGNVANGSPIGDSMPCLIALGASVLLRSSGGTRRMPLEDFYLDYQKTALRADEFVERIILPLPAPGQRFRAYKLAKRFDQDISIVLGAFSMRIDQGVMRDCRVAFGGMAAIPKRARTCEAALEGRVWEQATIDAAAQHLASDFQPIDDLRGSARYRMLAAKNLLKKFFIETSGSEQPARLDELAAIQS